VLAREACEDAGPAPLPLERAAIVRAASVRAASEQPDGQAEGQANAATDGQARGR